MRNRFIYIALIFFTFSCSSEKEIPASELYEIRNIGQLSTTEYTVGKIIKLVDSKSNLNEIEWKEWTEVPQYGDRKILISCKAKIKAGVDFTQLKEGDIKVSGTTIEIKLPPAKVTSFSMDPNSIHTEMENITGSRSAFTQAEKTQFLKQGEKAIKEDLVETGILADAHKNAEEFVKDFYSQMGFDKVIVTTTIEKK